MLLVAARSSPDATLCVASSRVQHEHGLKESPASPLCGTKRENENLTVASQAPPSSMTGIEVGGRRWKDNLPDMCLEDQVHSHGSLAYGSFCISIMELVLTERGLYPFYSRQQPRACHCQSNLKWMEGILF